MKNHEVSTGFGVVESLRELTMAELASVDGGMTTVPVKLSSESQIDEVNSTSIAGTSTGGGIGSLLALLGGPFAPIVYAGFKDAGLIP